MPVATIGVPAFGSRDFNQWKYLLVGAPFTISAGSVA